MKIYLVSNNLLLDGINYENNSNLEMIRMLRPLSSKGERIASKISESKEFQNIEKIYSSFHSSAISSAKYLSEKLDLSITYSSLCFLLYSNISSFVTYTKGLTIL